MRWFGTSWGAEICSTCEHIRIPKGHPCSSCRAHFTAFDQGVEIQRGDERLTVDYYHLDCWLKITLGMYQPRL